MVCKGLLLPSPDSRPCVSLVPIFNPLDQFNLFIFEGLVRLFNFIIKCLPQQCSSQGLTRDYKAYRPRTLNEIFF